MRVPFKTTLEESSIKSLRKIAVDMSLDSNDLLDSLILKYLKGEVDIKRELEEVKQKKKKK